MTPEITPERVAFLEARKKGIGGSDVASVFSLGYGCALRLYREKRGEVPDYPRQATGPMELGNILEPYFADKYQLITGRQVQRVDQFRHADHSELVVHVDRIIENTEEHQGPGVLEIKSFGREMYYKAKRGGMPIDYVLQLQHGMLVTGHSWGAFALGNREMGVSKPDDLLRWDVDRDEETCALIKESAIALWADIQAGVPPPMLEPDDDRCHSCEYRKSCQGAALEAIVPSSEYEQDETLAPLVRKHIELAALRKEANEMYADVHEELAAMMGDRTLVSADGAKVQYPVINKKAYSVAATKYRALKVYPRAEKKEKKGRGGRKQSFNDFD